MSAEPRPAPSRPGWVGVVVTACGILVAALIVLAIPELRHAVGAAIRGDTEEVRSQIDDLGATGPLVVFVLAQFHAVVFYPAEILNAAAGFAYGFWPALALVMFSWLVSGLIAYEIGRHAARPILYRLAGERRFQRAEDLIHQGGVTFLLLARLVPIVPYSIVCYVCGAARVPLPRYIWTTVVGYTPITAVFVYFGSRLDELSWNDPILIAGGVVLIVLLALTRWLAPKLTDAPEGEPTPQQAGK